MQPTTTTGPVGLSEPTATFTQSWLFPAALGAAVAAYACQFTQPFWVKPGTFTFKDDTRTAALPPFAGSAVVSAIVTETLREQTPTSNTYTLAGLENIDHYQGSFKLMPVDPGADAVRLTWQITFGYQGVEALVVFARVFAGGSDAMTAALQQEFPAGQPTAS